MAEPSSSSSSSTITSNWESNLGAASTSLRPPSNNVHGEGEEDRDGDRGTYNYQYTHPDIQIMEHDQHQQQQQQHNLFGIPYRGNFLFLSDEPSVIRDDTWSCIIVVLTFWFFVSMTLILGVYGAVGLSLGPNSSVLIEASPIFVQSIKVQRLDGTSNPRLMLYGLYDSPSLDVVKTWSTSHNASVPYGDKEWIYFLNRGSQINISYSVNPPSSSIFLIIAEGSEEVEQWREDPTYPNTTLSWNVIHGSGAIEQNIFNSESYYVALGNLNSNDVEVSLDLRVRSLLYDTTEAYYECSLAYGSCGLSVSFPNANYAVLTTPGSDEASSSDEWYVKVSYGPRWATYIVGIAGMTAIMFAAFNFLNRFRCYREEETGVQYREVESERAPLLQYKDDDLSSWGSSYESVSGDEKDFEEFLAANAIDGKPLKDGDNGNNTRRLCAICYDAPRDCFFLPCGHCVACFECGTRIVEAAGTCPMCRRKMKKVRKIFTV